MSVTEVTLQTTRLSALPADARNVVMQLFNSSKDNVRIGQYKEIDGSLYPAVSVYDILENVCKDTNPRQTWMNMNKPKRVGTIVKNLYDSPAIDFQMFNFPGKKATPVVKLDVALNIINNLSSEAAKTFRRANLNVFKRYLGGDKTLIPEIHAIDEAHLLNPDNGARAFRADVQHNQDWSQEFEERHRVIESTVYNASQGGLLPKFAHVQIYPHTIWDHAEKLFFASQLAATHQQSLVTPTGTKTTETILVSKHCTIHHLMDAMDLAVANASAPGNNLALEVEKTRQIEYQTKQLECVERTKQFECVERTKQLECVERTKQLELISVLSDKLSAENLLKVLQFALPVAEPPTPTIKPTPVPEPTPVSEPTLAPEPTPVSETTPVPEPTPVPGPILVPELTLAPEPTPVPEPILVPEPTPVPELTPVPEPTRVPVPTPVPEPTRVPPPGPCKRSSIDDSDWKPLLKILFHSTRKPNTSPIKASVRIGAYAEHLGNAYSRSHPALSVLDILSNVAGMEGVELKEKLRTITCLLDCQLHKFPKQGPATPVVRIPVALDLINSLPGESARLFRLNHPTVFVSLA
ncbi:hypothetical protein BJ741DRAFT_679417 [Chytriomyces cf. hyalinus JEL632]|nr:hypothetical protein BJ741DRAFT_679417 [Chytriomyces cf. hyalinus JEL632]